MRLVGKYCLIIGLGFHLSVFLEMFLVQYNARQDTETSLVSTSTKLFALLISICLFVGFYFAAGKLRKDFIHIGVFPDESSRGTTNTW